MHIVLLAAECAPVAKAGGLGDFVHGLGRALMATGAEVEVFLPGYDCLKREWIDNYSVSGADLAVEFAGQSIVCTLATGAVDGLPCRFLAPQSDSGFFQRGRIYGEPDDPLRFASFCRAALAYLEAAGRWPDILHCNDWQTGLIPVLLYEDYEKRGVERTRVCYSLHNLGHQGWVDPAVLRALNLNEDRLMTSDRLRESPASDRANLMQGGIRYSNFVTTVSPRYAWEAMRTDQGRGLQAVLASKSDQFAGVLNGIDDNSWNPLTDPALSHPFGPEALDQKALSTRALRHCLDLREADKPLLAIVSRLDQQKGVELMEHAVRYSLSLGAQFVLLGSSLDVGIQSRFEGLRDELMDNPDCHLELGYDETLAHRIYAGSDMMVVPSLYEPCGLTQLIAMRYGSVPVVRRVGGLADTVFDANFCGRPMAERNGFVFDGTAPADLEFALERAIGLWFNHRDCFETLRLNGMRQDHSWREPARRYLGIYQHLLAQLPAQSDTGS